MAEDVQRLHQVHAADQERMGNRLQRAIDEFERSKVNTQQHVKSILDSISEARKGQFAEMRIELKRIHDILEEDISKARKDIIHRDAQLFGMNTWSIAL
ncbi:unnamed protein product [Tilletia caries]|nr:hypothetical protein CF335_g5596 [Tilletia laevis]CAD6885231.1 unnamed protein product [Tilletia caries]